MPNNALQRNVIHRGRPVLAKGWRARRGGMGIVHAAELDRWKSLMSVRGAFCVAAGIAAVGCGSSMPASPQVPVDVAAFVERRGICDHLRGEEPYNAERRAELVAGTEKYCRGTDRELAALRLKYRGNPAAVAALRDLEETIEARK